MWTRFSYKHIKKKTHKGLAYLEWVGSVKLIFKIILICSFTTKSTFFLWGQLMQKFSWKGNSNMLFIGCREVPCLGFWVVNVVDVPKKKRKRKL